MSAVRSNERRGARRQRSLPYSRPASQPKKSSWSFSNLFSFLNPLRSTSPEERDEVSNGSEEDASGDQSVEEDAEGNPPAPAEVLSQRGHEISQGLSLSSPLSPIGRDSHLALGTPTHAREQVVTSPPHSRREGSAVSPSPRENLDVVRQFLSERDDDRPLNSVEYTGLIALLQSSVDDEVPEEPFRFSPTPSRAGTPTFNMGSTSTPARNGSSHLPQRTLSKNPNGVYKWQGAGSARPRNRFQSPAFGAPRPSPTKIKLSPPESPKKTDTKRRRVGADAEMSTPHRVDAPAPSTPPSSRGQQQAGPSQSPTSPSKSTNGVAANGHTSSTTAPPSTPRLRLSVPPKPTTPAVPSPLRNTWGANDNSPPQPPNGPRQPTRAANFMSELIKEVTPPKKPDVANPYQTASPVKAGLPKKATRKRKAPEEKPKEKEKEIHVSPQRIIEATVPKGSTRSRPPADLRKPPVKSNGVSHSSSSAEPPRRSARLKSPSPPPATSLNGLSTLTSEKSDDEQPSPKKQKTSANGRSTQDVEIEDVDMSSSPSQPVTRPAEIIEPSESTSSQLDTKPSSAPIFGANGGTFSSTMKPFVAKSSAPKEPSKLRFGFAADTEEEPAPAKAPEPAPTTASTTSSFFGSSKPPVSHSPSFGGFSSSSTGSSTSALGSSTSAFGGSFGASASTSSSALGDKPAAVQPSSTTAKASPPSTAPAPTASDSVNPALTTPTPAKTTATFSSTTADPKDAAKTVSVSLLPTFSFTIPSTASYPTDHANECKEAKAADISSLPSFSISFDKLEKAPVEPAKAAPASTPAPASSGFNWAAAGIKPPPKAAGATWSCGTCMLTNPDSAQDCTVCEAPRP
ncbi:hypothetical protein FA95DRAFT_1423917 [Auriscalpium vulgare]|uniref:Uncharacterized protein n=1 Tax=Auriscalpium vulgare TaxID=40419 RepID=A0ACB8RP31_9AGAM|nr:hypothetical protein FA95DRAFT_1423917 [Auriscalpium vulgare]